MVDVPVPLPGVECRASLHPADAELDLACLSEDEVELLATFRSANRRQAFALGRTCLRTWLADRLESAPSEIDILVADDGALELPDTGLFVSLAHTHRGGTAIATVAIADRAVGIDVEPITPRHPDLPGRILNEREKGLIQILDADADRSMVAIWTIKEAVLKARRSGLRYAPRNLTIQSHAPDKATVQGADGSRWEVAWQERFGCIVSVAAAPNEG